MSSVKNGKKKDIKIILLGILVGLVVCGAGIYGVVSSRIASHEYKNSTAAMSEILPPQTPACWKAP